MIKTIFILNTVAIILKERAAPIAIGYALGLETNLTNYNVHLAPAVVCSPNVNEITNK